MDAPHRSTKLKVAFGYLLLTVLLLGSIGYIYGEMQSLTGHSDHEAVLIRRRHVTNQIISQLYQAEVIGQSLSTGQLEQYHRYKHIMRQAYQAVDSLRGMLADSLQRTRLDTVSQLLVEKERNMRHLLKALQDGGADQLYQQHIDELIAEQDSLLSLPHVRRKVVTHTNSYTIRKKPKKFFQRLGEVFAPGKADSTRVSNVIQEEYTDTLTEAYSPADTVATLLKDIQQRVTDTHQQRIVTVNRRTQSLRLSGLKLSQKVNQLLSTIEDEEQALAQNRHQQEETMRQHSIRTVAGIAITAVALAALFLILIWRDITRSNHYRRELEKAKHRAEGLLEAREKLMLTITHDIKAPVGSLLGYTDLMKRITTEERQCFYLNNMQSSANHLLGLVNSLLDFHRLDAHKMEIQHVSFNPRQLFDAIYTSFTPLAARKHLALEYTCQEALDGVYINDPFRIRQIAENLLSNALKFTKQGSIRLHAVREEGQLHFSVSDTGCGIGVEEQQRIFQEFTRLHNAQGEEGFGLGLAITRKLVQLLEGTIRLESRLQQGSTFHVYLPLPKGPASSASSAQEMHPSAETRPTAEATAAASLPADPIRILLIDDDRIQLQLTAAMLDRPNLQVVCCEHPETLFHRLKKEAFDVLLTDIQMPAINGFDLLRAVHALDAPAARHLPVIAITARHDMDAPYFQSQGFAGCLHKPFTQKELLEAVAQATQTSIAAALPSEAQTRQAAEKASPQALHFQALTAFSEDDPEAAAEIIETFIGETEKHRQQLAQAIAHQDLPSLSALAHKLLPLFTMLGATTCVPLLRRLEEKRGETTFTAHEAEDAQTVWAETGRILQAAREYLHRL